MAGNNRRSSKGSRVRPGRAPQIEVRAAGRGLRLEQLEDRLAPAIFQDGIPTWLESGPGPILNGVPSIPPDGPATGAVDAISPHPTNPNILFAAGVNGGVWRTFNALAPSPTWVPLTDQMPSLSVASMDINPANPNQLLVGIGSVSSAVGRSGDLVGVMYTENALAPTPSFRVITGPVNPATGQFLLADQTFKAAIARNGYLLVAGTGGVYRSLDRGFTWTKLDGSTTLPAGAQFDTAADPGAPNRVYVVGPNGVFRTEDITAPSPSWFNATDPLMQIGAGSHNGKIAIHNSPGNNVVYVATANPAPNAGQQRATVTWSTNGGASWSVMDEGVTLAAALSVTDATNASPVSITIGGVIDHGINTGDRVLVEGVQGNPGANGVWTVTRTSATAITLNGSTGTGVYTGGGSVREIFGTNPVGQAFLHFALVADPVNPNMVYLSGDAQEGPFPGSSGGRGGANILRGDRSLPRGFNDIAPSPQWIPITDNEAAGGGAPHADSRHLVFDAAGNLLEGDDGGVYRRSDPRTSNGSWSSPIGNLALGQFSYKVELDVLNNVIFGGTQDTGSIEQLDGAGPAGNRVWDEAVGGDGFWQGVDNTGKQQFGTTFRYMMSNTVELFFRRQFDANNTLINSSRVLLASPANPTKAFDGLDGSDKGSFGANVFTINSVDGRMMMLGINKLYEDDNLDPALGKAGDVIANITPANFGGKVTSIVYGGRQNGIGITRVAWVGTNAGQLWLRGAAGGFVDLTANLPGTGPIEDIVTDPDDWRTAYVLQDNRIFRTNDAGVTWVEITENLAATGFDASGNTVGGLSTDIRTISLWDPNPGSTSGQEILLAGGRGGVFRYVPGVADPAVLNGNWLEYGVGLPNDSISNIGIYGNVVIASTQGRGVWRIQDVSSTIAAKATVRVVGTAGNDTLSLQADGSNPAFVIVSDGVKSLRVERTVVQAFVFQAGAGADSVVVRANGQPGGDLSFVRFPIAIDLGGDEGDFLAFENGGRSTPARVTVTANTIGAAPTDTIFSNLGGTLVTYTGLQKGTLRLDLGSDFVNGNQVLVKSTSASVTHVIGTRGYDDIQVNSNAGTDLSGNLAGIVGTLIVDGRTQGSDRLILSDFGSQAGNGNVVIGKGFVTGLAGPTDSSAVLYVNIPDLQIQGSNSAVLPETFTVQNPSAVLTLLAQGGPDNLNVRSSFLPVTANGGAGNDVIRISSLAGISDNGDLAGILGGVTADGGAGDNQLIVSNFSAPTGTNVGISSDVITGPTPVGISYLSTGGRFFTPAGDGIVFRGSNNGPDNFSVFSSLAGSQIAVDGNGGNDVYSVDGESLAGGVWLRGGEGNDSFGMNIGVFGVTADALRFSGGNGSDTTAFNGFEIDENLTVTITDAVTATVAGVGNTFAVDTLELLSYDAAGGRNNLTVADATNQSYGSVADPASGIVFQSTGATSGRVAIASGAVGPAIAFTNVNGSDAQGVVIDGDPTGTGQFTDVLTVLGTSDVGLDSGLGEPTAADGSDEINVSGTGVFMRNNSLGFLRAVAVGRTADGRPTLRALVVKAGNELNQGDRVTVVPAGDLNIFVDGGLPTRASVGDKLNIGTTVGRTVTAVDDPALGPPQARVVFDDGTSFGFVGFENAGAAARRVFAVGADAGGGPRVQVFDAANRSILFDGFVYDPSFRGGVRVATGDVTGDGVPDLVTAAGFGGGPHIQVFDGVTFELINGFFAYEPSFSAGVYVAVGDVTGDGIAEIVAGTGFGGGPLVRVFSQFGIDLGAFFAYSEEFRGGVRVAVGDTNGDGIGEVITAAGPGGGPHVRVFDFATLSPIEEYFALAPDYTGGLYVSAGDMDGDGKAEIAAAPGGFEAPQVQIRRSNGTMVPLSVFDVGPIATPGPLPSVNPGVLSATGSPSQFEAGIRVAMTQVDGSGNAQLIAARGPGFVPRVHAYSLDPFQETFNVMALDGEFSGGVFVG
ncbi:MAG TPA: hypothetical protein VM533_08660 [Fimbriiglobus sp.]|nr:hypothetical protein [Fimbriiglobus sp.]